MKKLMALVTAAALMAPATWTLAQTAQSPPIPGVQPARDVPSAKHVPDPNATHKVVFDLVNAASNVDEVNPGLNAVARYVNTLAKYGVPPERRQIAVVLHQGTTDIIVNNETFKARNGGHDNPNIPLIQALSNAGVDFRVCGQAVMGRQIDPKTILPEIQLDLWALTTLIDLQSKGYVRIGGG